jgi:hypothetical protein
MPKKTPQTYKEWDDLAKTMTREKKDELIKALEALKEWDEFKAAFGWTHMFVLISTLKFN